MTCGIFSILHSTDMFSFIILAVKKSCPLHEGEEGVGLIATSLRPFVLQLGFSLPGIQWYAIARNEFRWGNIPFLELKLYTIYIHSTSIIFFSEIELEFHKFMLERHHGNRTVQIYIN